MKDILYADFVYIYIFVQGKSFRLWNIYDVYFTISGETYTVKPAITFWVSRCDVRYDFRIETMFGSSSPPV